MGIERRMDTMDELLTAEEVAALNDARILLRRMAKRAMSHPTADHSRRQYSAESAGRVAGYCESAEHALFMVLNIANAYCGLDLTDDQLHKAAAAGFGSA